MQEAMRRATRRYQKPRPGCTSYPSTPGASKRRGAPACKAGKAWHGTRSFHPALSLQPTQLSLPRPSRPIYSAAYSFV